MTDRNLTPEEIEALKTVKAAYDEAESEFAQAIGIFTMRFSKLEADMNHAIGDFLGLHTMNLTAMLTSAIRSVTTRINILSSLAHGSRMSDELKTQLLDCVKEIGDRNTYRNWLLHEPFHPGMLKRSDDESADLKEWTKIRARTDEKFRYQEKDFTADQILEEAKLCGPLGTKIISLTRRYCGERDEEELP